MRCVALAVPFIAITRIVSAYFYAAGNGKKAALLIYAEPVIFTPLFLFSLPRFLDAAGIWLSYPFTQIANTLLAAVLKKISK